MFHRVRWIYLGAVLGAATTLGVLLWVYHTRANLVRQNTRAIARLCLTTQALAANNVATGKALEASIVEERVLLHFPFSPDANPALVAAVQRARRMKIQGYVAELAVLKQVDALIASVHACDPE